MRSALFPAAYPFLPMVNADQRGALHECVRSRGTGGQTFMSTTHPGQVRGEHYHLRKIERFHVLRGTAEIALRRVLTDEMVRFKVDGDTPALLDMPTMWVHNIRNAGDSELVTLFWADQLFDPEHPDTFRSRSRGPADDQGDDHRGHPAGDHPAVAGDGRLDETVDHVLVHTGQNYDYELNQVFFDELGLRPPGPLPRRGHVESRRASWAGP